MFRLKLKYRDYVDLLWRLAILDIVIDKRVDVNTYIFNTDNYDEYLFESSHLDEKYILSKDEYNLCKCCLKKD